ncbi:MULTISPECIES: N-acetylmuramoyl-L-alanine amidase [Caproicibacterium]|uniref:N-acetylmuramoyl-L-alanine amidase n=1 Tax=Caproicibacterium argilliputei TaxID=3030016 RepID=A0AA97D5K7_9FIRM|nr:N-acetylmuramoyl-L-alanine amidase [Caproicibacterium argilliputei]WOC31010.1 N-acetylmuramoyl-L-alanine amidase [Caproicibacterium argilliputei]
MKVIRTNIWTILTLVAACMGFLILIYLSSFHAAQDATAATVVKPLVVLDAGHGGEDGGAVGHSPVPEKTINLAITKKIEKALTDAGCRIVMTRDQDEMLGDASLSTLRERKASDIYKRFAILQSNPGCVFVSIHQNHFSNGIYSGAQVFYSTNNPKSKDLAEQIRQAVVASVQPENKRQNKAATSSIYLLKHAQDPAVLVECGFLSNDSEEKLLNDEKYQQKMADAIAKGILQYLKGTGRTASGESSTAAGSQGLYSSASSSIINKKSKTVKK